MHSDLLTSLVFTIKKNHAYTDANIACKICKPKVRYLYIYYVFFVFRSNCVNGTVIVLYNEILKNTHVSNTPDMVRPSFHLDCTLFMFSVRTPMVRRHILKYTQNVEIISLHILSFLKFSFTTLLCLREK